MVHELNTSGFQAQAAEAGNSPAPENYDAFVIGSPLYGGKWISVAGLFAALMAERMKEKPVALFSMGALSIKNPEAGLAEHKEFLKNLCKVAPSLNVVADEIFTGYFERSNLPWYLKLVDRFAPTPQGDHRDWIKIQKWSKSLVRKFHPAM